MTMFSLRELQCSASSALKAPYLFPFPTWLPILNVSYSPVWVKDQPSVSHGTLATSLLPPTVLDMFTSLFSPLDHELLDAYFVFHLSFLSTRSSTWKKEAIHSGTRYLLLLILCLKFCYFVLFINSNYWAPTIDLVLNKIQSLKLSS